MPWVRRAVDERERRSPVAGRQSYLDGPLREGLLPLHDAARRLGRLHLVHTAHPPGLAAVQTHGLGAGRQRDRRHVLGAFFGVFVATGVDQQDFWAVARGG